MKNINKKNGNTDTLQKKQRTKIEREKHLAAIAAFERTYPVKYTNLDLFAESVAKQLNIAVGTARRDIQEVRRRRKHAAKIDQSYELGKKLEELAAVKELSLASNNINAYLGAINKECELLGLDKLSIFIGAKDDVEISISLKKKSLSEKLTPPALSETEEGKAGKTEAEPEIQKGETETAAEND